MSKVRIPKGRDSSFDSTTVFISSSGKSNPKSSGTSRKGKAFSFHFAHVSTLNLLSVSVLCLIFASRGWQLLNPFRIKGWLFTFLFSKDHTENCIKGRRNEENWNAMFLSRYLLLYKSYLLLTYGSISSQLSDTSITCDRTTLRDRLSSHRTQCAKHSIDKFVSAIFCVLIKSTILWCVMPCSLIDVCRRFGGIILFS